jgi:drug/metabolite transporter (DMT)-like permease
MQRYVQYAGITATQERSRELAGLLAGLCGISIFGLTLPMTRIALEGFDRYMTGLGRAIPAAILAAIILAVTRQPVPPRRYWPGLMMISAGIIFGFPTLASAAMEYVPAAHGGVVMAILPLATAMAAAIIGDERPSVGFWLAGIAGSLLVLAFAVIEAGGLTLQRADFLLAAAVVAAAIGYAESGILARQIGGWQVISWALVFSLPVIVPTVWLLGAPINWHAPASAWLSFAYLALMSQFFGFFFWNTGLALAGVARTGQLQLLQPFITLAGSVLLLGERVGWRHAGFALAVAAIVAIGRQLRVAERSAER